MISLIHYLGLLSDQDMVVIDFCGTRVVFGMNSYSLVAYQNVKNCTNAYCLLGVTFTTVFAFFTTEQREHLLRTNM